MKMKTVQRVNEVKPDLSLINFVRPNALIGAPFDRDLWHEDKYIGSVSSGTMIQYFVEPGTMLFLTNNHDKGWSNVLLEVEPGNKYFVKVEAALGGFLLKEITLMDKDTKEWVDALSVKSVDWESSKENDPSDKEDARNAVIMAKWE